MAGTRQTARLVALAQSRFFLAPVKRGKLVEVPPLCALGGIQ